MSEQLDEIRTKLKDLSLLFSKVDDATVEAFLSGPELNDLLKSLGPPGIDKSANVYEHLMKWKWRYTTMALIRMGITQNCAIKVQLDTGHEAYISPAHYQWLDDGLMFFQGEKPFEGLIGIYREKHVQLAVVARDIAPGENIGPNDVLFVDVEDVRKQPRNESPCSVMAMDTVVAELRGLLNRHAEDESVYQDFLTRNPWIFGAQYTVIQPHVTLNDKNIPDFSGVRVRDGARDIIEIKQPFLKLFRSDGGLSAVFHDAWAQCERYLHFVDQEHDYLRREKGLRFENSHCFLMIGSGLTDGQMGAIRVKEKMNQRITVYTFDDLARLAENTANLLRSLKDGK